MENFTKLSDIQDKQYFIFKHSNTCPISSMAHDVVASQEKLISIPIYKLIVQEDRASSKEIAEHFGIRHESPQLILVDSDEAVWEASHGSITPSSIKLALEKL
jgi:bacillithiol system protein YtxJ